MLLLEVKATKKILPSTIQKTKDPIAQTTSEYEKEMQEILAKLTSGVTVLKAEFFLYRARWVMFSFMTNVFNL
jgi:hypothetical protein